MQEINMSEEVKKKIDALNVTKIGEDELKKLMHEDKMEAYYR